MPPWRCHQNGCLQIIGLNPPRHIKLTQCYIPHFLLHSTSCLSCSQHSIPQRSPLLLPPPPPPPPLLANLCLALYRSLLFVIVKLHFISFSVFLYTSLCGIGIHHHILITSCIRHFIFTIITVGVFLKSKC